MSDPQELAPDELAAWQPFAALLELMPAQVDSRLQRSAGQPLVNLAVLGHLRQAATRSAGLSELAACASCALPRMSRTIARMEADGLVERTACETDGRAVTVRLTDRGDAVLAAATPHRDRIVRELVVDALSPEQLAQLRDIAGVLAARLHPDSAAPTDRQRAARG